MKRLKDLFKLNRQKLKVNKADLKERMKDIQAEELKRISQLDHFVDHVARKELKQIVFRCWVVFRNAKKFRRNVRS